MQGIESIPPGRAGIAHNLGRAGNGLRKRTYIVLLGALLVMTLAVSGLTIKLLQGQRTLLEETLRDAQAQTMALLSNRIEQAIFSTLRNPFLALKNIPPQEVEMTRYDHVRKTFPEVEQVLFLKPDLSLQNSLPPPAGEADRRLNDFLVQRTAMEDLNSREDRYVLHTFVDTVDGRPTLFALQRVSEMDRASGWILIRFNLDVIKRKRITPLLKEFSAKLGGEVRLNDPDAPWNDNALNWPVGRVLPGWLLVSKTSSQAAGHLKRDRALMMGVTAGVILAMLMAAFAVWRELRREHALVDLRNRFVANVSHELKTPLALIRMYAETLYLRRVTDEERLHQYHRILLHEAERLSQMINTVLDFSRLSQGVDLYQLTATDLRRTVTEVLNSYRWRTEDAGLQLEVCLDEAIPPVAHDRYGITQILRNLIDNAVKYAAAGGVVRVALRASRERGIELAVSDHGPGIPAEDRERVRQPFQRGREADPVSGSGLGLALVDQIAKSHHARLILATPADGAGLEAIVRFPPPPAS